VLLACLTGYSGLARDLLRDLAGAKAHSTLIDLLNARINRHERRGTAALV